MRIGIDARWIFEKLSGIGAYTRELVRTLAEIDTQNEYTIFFENRCLMDRELTVTGIRGKANFSARMLPWPIFSIKNQWAMLGMIRDLRLDVFHSTNYMIPLFAFPSNRKGRTRCVVTIHDVIPLMFPHYAPKAKKARLFPIYKRLMVEIGRRANVILTDSESSRRDVQRELRIPEARSGQVLAVPIGVSPLFKPGQKKKNEVKTILYVGRLDPYKNVPGLIRVFDRVRELTKEDVRLQIVGPEDARYPEAPKLAGELGVKPWVSWIGYVSDEALVQAYQQADVVALLSRYEGFGLPVLEAMACGTPVVCSNTSSLPEVADEAAIQVNPDDIDAAAKAILRVLHEPALAAGMTEKGLKQAALFTWRRTAETTRSAYLAALE